MENCRRAIPPPNREPLLDAAIGASDSPSPDAPPRRCSATVSPAGAAPLPLPLDSLPAEVLSLILAFVGPGHHRYVAGSCRTLRGVYSALFAGEAARRGGKKDGSDKVEKGRNPEGGSGGFLTFWGSAAASLPCARLCLDEAGEEGRRRDSDDGPAARRVAEAAARGGNLDVLRWLEGSRGLRAAADSRAGRSPGFQIAHLMSKDVRGFSFFTSAGRRTWRLVDHAALGGRLPVIWHLVRSGSVCDDITGLIAAYGGNVDVLHYLAEENVPLDFACVAAAKGGHIASLEYLQGIGMEMHMMALEAACLGGKVETTKWLLDKLGPIGQLSSREASVAAATSGNLQLVALLRENGFCWDRDMMLAAAFKGHLHLVRYLHEHGCPWDPTICFYAATCGHLDVLQYAHSNGCPLDSVVFKSIAFDDHRFHHFHILQYLHQNGFKWDESMIRRAAGCGNLELVEFLHNKGCSWSPLTCAAAAGNGHQYTLEWLRKHGCPWDNRTLLEAERMGHNDLATWARQNGCPE